MPRKSWTKEQVEILTARYPHELTQRIADDIGRSVTSCYGKAKQLGLKKSDAFFGTDDSGRTTGKHGQSTRFRKGHVPWTKGMKGYDAGGRSHETRFKKGHKPVSSVPVGTEVIDGDGYLKRKVRDDAPPGQSRFNWQFVHVIVWEEAHGPRPPGHSIVFKDGDKQNISIDNLECISRRDLMKRNTIHNYPKPVVEVIQQKARLTREINKQRNASEEQHR